MRHRSPAEPLTPTVVGIGRQTTSKGIVRLLDECDITAVSPVSGLGK
ncbi:hypothetical protein [Streptomyces sp. NPDC047974]